MLYINASKGWVYKKTSPHCWQELRSGVTDVSIVIVVIINELRSYLQFVIVVSKQYFKFEQNSFMDSGYIGHNHRHNHCHNHRHNHDHNLRINHGHNLSDNYV